MSDRKYNPAQVNKVDDCIGLAGAMASINKVTKKKVLSPNEFLIETYMDKERDIEIRIKAAQAAKKDNKESPDPSVNVNLNMGQVKAPVSFDLDEP